MLARGQSLSNILLVIHKGIGTCSAKFLGHIIFAGPLGKALMESI